VPSYKRFVELVKYNRDWLKYILCRYKWMQDGDVVTFQLRNGQNIQLFSDGRFVLNEIYLDRVYDIPGVDFKQCRSVLDLGANIGVFALYVASRSPQTEVYCFEPYPRNFELLTRNLTTNRVPGRAFQFAVAAHCGTGYLELGSSVEHALSKSGSDGTKVECVDLKRVFDLAGVERFDFVKMDIEGAESEIFKRCTDDQLRRMGALAIEWHHSVSELQTVGERLQNIGFEVKIEVLPGNIRYLKARLR
jgi:FkbM family methyltransferase